MKTAHVIAAVFSMGLVAALAGCVPQMAEDLAPSPDSMTPDTGNDSNPPDAAPDNAVPPKDIVGVWKRQSGELAIVDSSLGKLGFLEFDSSGIANLSIRDPESNVLICEDALFTKVSDDAVLLDGGASRLAGRAFFSTRVALVDMPDDDTLRLLDDTSNELAVFQRVASIPDEEQCDTLDIVAEFDGFDEAHYGAGLAFDGTSLWYTRDSDGKVIPIDPATGAAGTPLDLLPNFNKVHAAQDGDFWAVCFCGSTDLIQRRNAAAAVVDAIPDSITPFSFDERAIAFDPVEKIVWVHGSNRDKNGQPVFLKIDAEQEPDVLVSTFDFNFSFEAITYDGKFLYGIASYLNVIVQIDPASGKAVATYQLPDRRNVEWDALAIVDSDFYVLGDDYRDGTSFLVQLSRN